MNNAVSLYTGVIPVHLTHVKSAWRSRS